MTAPICPLLAKSCIEQRCKFWLHETWTNSETGETRAGFECLFILDYQMARSQVAEQIRTQASTDKVATEIARGREASQRVLLGIAQRRALSEAADARG